MKRIILALLIPIIHSAALFAQEEITYELTLEESIEVAKGKSLRMLRLEQSLKRAEYNLQSVKTD